MTTGPGRLLDGVQMTTVVVRVADLDRSMAWYRDKLGMVPLHTGADGSTPPYAVYDACGVILTMWQLAPGQRRIAIDNERNSYVIFVYGGDVEALWDRLVAAGVKADAIHDSANNRFFWFYDLDDNRWEVSQPTSDEQRAAAEEIMGR
jgi:catechol 2,3-dioxygenase-like lactoylglutathione lyase family enzyme